MCINIWAADVEGYCEVEMDNTIQSLYDVILQRKEHGEEGSYTAYLFEQGVDKILKKIGEEATEVVIASKNLELASETDPVKRDELKNEICDLIYHLLVLMAKQDIPLEEIQTVLESRSLKTGNLKKQKVVDKNT